MRTALRWHPRGDSAVFLFGKVAESLNMCVEEIKPGGSGREAPGLSNHSRIPKMKETPDGASRTLALCGLSTSSQLDCLQHT